MGPILALIFSKLCQDESCFNIRSTDEVGPSGNATDYPYVYGIIQSQAPTLN
jgi:hypothetical protein